MTKITQANLSDSIPQFHLPDAIALLSRTPATLDSLLRDLPESLTHRNEGPETWNCFDIVGHLIHGERTDWIPRARIILAHGDTRTFDTFDRLAHQRESQGKSLPALLDEFTRLRAENLATLRAMNLTPAQLALPGRHPQLGAVTLSELLATWAAHDLTHLHQISRVLAHQFRPSVGPWTKFLGVLLCSAHSS
jgi:DinB superfamily